ncbi:serine hydrolase domain-containing protein [Capnocytophaga sp. ARDL2]|uniref:serine hydrolase domain-containing protein n=1 Tax=Capnocytophaga sp. ARDL2 TaxID=3238809 RepID=UPI003556BFE4
MLKRFLLLVVALWFTQSVFAQIVGRWKGDLDIQGVKLPLVFEIKATENGYNTTAYSPKQTSMGIPTSKTVFQNNALTVEISALQASFKGVLKDGKITGTFTQGKEFPLVLEKTNEEIKAVEDPVIADLGNRAINTQKLSAYLDYLVEKQKIAGSISIFRKGKEVYKKHFGQEFLPTKNYNQQTAYQIGSITKLFMATMLMQEVEKGTLNLNDKLEKFFPKMPNAQNITLQQMLNHTSGLKDYVTGEWLTEKAFAPQVIYDTIVKQGVDFQPGEKQKYSNSAYYLLCKILEQTTQQPFNVLLRERIAKPLNLDNTFSALDRPTNIFASYNLHQTQLQEVKDFNFINALGAGDITATTTDLNRFVEALFKGKLLKKETLQQMMPVEKTWGLCVMKAPFYNKTSYGHGGTTLGTDAIMTYNPEDDLSISLCINARGMFSNNEITIGILNILYELPFDFEKE